jgi:hypothetical protein
MNDPEGVMSDKKSSGDDSCLPAKGVSVPDFTTRISNLAERAREPAASKRSKLPPRPGRLPDAGEVDLDRVLNRDSESDKLRSK